MGITLVQNRFPLGGHFFENPLRDRVKWTSPFYKGGQRGIFERAS